MARDAAKDATMTDDEERDDEEQEDDERDEQEESNGNGGGDHSLFESLKSQLGEHRNVLAPVATSAAAAAATYAAKKLPGLIEQIESGGSGKIREKLDDAKDAGGAKGLVAGAASRAFSSGGGSFFERLTQGGEDEAKEQAKDSGGVTGAMAKVADKVGGGSKGGAGWGRGRRLPLMFSVDVAAPVRTVYDQWTQFEELSSFMHRVESVDQEEDEQLTWHTNVWGRRRHWKVQINEQVPDQRIEYELKGGGQGSGVVTFHELAPRLTRVEVVFDWQPRGLLEKTASGFRIHKRAARSDLKRFKAFVETRGEATGGWRGKIEDGEAQGETRNKRNRKADPIPSDAKQHSEEDEKKAKEKGGDDKEKGGDDNGNRDEAREERKRHREERAKQRKEAA
jgi:uncharacterized membrane protein